MPAPHTTSLRREIASTVAVLADQDDFTAMRQYQTFAFDDHARYLDHVDDLLRTLAAEDGHVTVSLFDPEDYTDYCADTGIEPDDPASRTRYTAELAATGPRIPYTGQPLADLIKTLVDTAVRHATHAYATMLLADAGNCPDCGQDIAHAAFEYASRLLLRILDAAGPGTHHFVCSIPAADETLIAGLHATRDTTGATHFPDAENAEFLTVLAVGIALGSHGGLVLRTTTPGARDRAHGWRLLHGRLHPLTEAEVFNAYWTDAHTGELIAPELHVDYRAGFPLTLDDRPHC